MVVKHEFNCMLIINEYAQMNMFLINCHLYRTAIYSCLIYRDNNSQSVRHIYMKQLAYLIYKQIMKGMQQLCYPANIGL